MPVEPLTRFQSRFFTALTLCGFTWLLVMTGWKEYWGFWQSPEVYHYLQTEYPQWLRQYVLDWYYPFFFFMLFSFAGWLSFSIRALMQAPVGGKSYYRKLGSILAMVLFFGMILGVLGSNNFIGILDQGRLHGVTHLQVQPTKE